MKIMRKLLHNLGDVWNTLPKEVPFLSIQKGAGTHTMVTVDEGSLYFHSRTYSPNLPQKQEILLDELTTAELITTIESMGYVAELTSEALESGMDAHKPFILMEVENVELEAELNAFTSNVWKTLYPIYRVLREAEFNIDIALKQLHRDIAKGDWLDYWASFFAIERERGESDNTFARRFTMWLFNPKTNNIAIKELLAYRLKDNTIEVEDVEPNVFQLQVGTQYIEDASALNKILSETKAAGVEYILSYLADVYEEDYKLWLSDVTGRPFENNDEGKVQISKDTSEDAFPVPSEGGYTGSIQATMNETFETPSEEHGAQMQSTSTESWTRPITDILTWVFAIVYSETYDVPTQAIEALQNRLQSTSEDTYTGFSELTNIDDAFALGDSELVYHDLFDSEGLESPNDIANITVTVGGEVVRSVIV